MSGHVPWTLGEQSSLLGSPFIPIQEGDWTVCEVYADHTGDKPEFTPEIMARVHLIAAAPELLEALKALLAANDHAVTMMMECDTQEAALHVARAQAEAFSKLLDPAREAIAKATSPTTNTQAILRDQGRG